MGEYSDLLAVRGKTEERVMLYSGLMYSFRGIEIRFVMLLSSKVFIKFLTYVM